MSKKTRVILASLLAVPMLALGISMTPVMQGVASAETSIQQGANDAQGEGQSDSLFGDGGVFQTITNTALFIIGAVSVLMLIYGGIRYTISMGDAKNVEVAKNTIMYAVIGIVVAVLAYAIVNFVLTSLIN